MSIFLADLDATCASLGYFDGVKYEIENNTFQSLKHLIWVLRRDGDTHEYRRHLGRTKLLQTDLLPMLTHCDLNEELADVLLRLLVNLTSPTILLYREELPKDGHGRRNYLEQIEILQGYKEAFASQAVWARLCTRLQKSLEIDWATRSEDQGILIERVLVLVRNILQVPANVDAERRADNDASLHDQLLWALQKAGILDLIIFVVSSQHENQYHLHALEIICLVCREQTVEGLAHATLQRSATEKQHDDQQLVDARRREKMMARPPQGRHSRFGGTYVARNVKSISDNNLICHQALKRALDMNFDHEKTKQKVSKRFSTQEDAPSERRSALSIRLFLREFCKEILQSAYNTLVRHVRRTLEHNATQGNDDSFLLWAIRFFMEFNRCMGFQVELVSESLTVQCFYWVLGRIEHHLDMMTSDKSKARQWAKRLHIAVNTFKELLLSLLALKSVANKETSEALFNMLLHNVCYVLEYRECVLHLIINFNEAFSTRSYLQDAIELAHIFFKLMEKFCQGRVVVQNRAKNVHKKKKAVKKKPIVDMSQDNVEDRWAIDASEISTALQISPPELNEPPKPYDPASDIDMDIQREDCAIRIHKFLHQKSFDHAVNLLRSARDLWPETEVFGKADADAENELNVLREIYIANFGIKFPMAADNNTDAEASGSSDGDDDEEREEVAAYTESDFKFEDFVKRLVNTRVVRACTTVLGNWETLPPRALKSIITLLHRISFECKMPAMLYQATLFRVFQRALASPTSDHNKELKRLCIYVMRQFTTTAVGNPKIYAELLFSKTIKEANDLEMGYTDRDEGVKGTWSEEQEDELRRLFQENQSNPQDERDVIDWILDNLIERTRTRRAIIKKLKDLGLIFKAPTKKSNAARVGKGAWLSEHDEQLHRLYDEFRLMPDCLKKMSLSLMPHRSKEAIIKRMIEIGIIMNRSEVLKKRNNKKSETGQPGSSDTDSDLDILSTVITKPKNKSKSVARKVIKKLVVKFNTQKMRSVMKQMSDINDEGFKYLVEWVQEGISEAADDYEEAEEENEVPLVPYKEEQRTALESKDFQNFLTTLGLQAPTAQMEKYWRIPSDLKKDDLLVRANVLTMFLNGDDALDGIEETAADESSHVTAEETDNVNRSDSDDDIETVVPFFERHNKNGEQTVNNESDRNDNEAEDSRTFRRVIQNDGSDDSDVGSKLAQAAPIEEVQENGSPNSKNGDRKRIRSDSENDDSDGDVVVAKQKRRLALNYDDSE